jgi:drug/metabolite transporter (DMT)-like permease
MSEGAINRQMKSGEWIMVLMLALVWGGSFFFNGVAVRELPTMTIVLGRVGLAAVILILFLRFRGEVLPKNPKIWGAFFIMGLTNSVVPFGLIVWGQGYITSGQASILNSTTPIFTVMVAHFFTADEKMQMRHLFGVFIGFAGVAVMMGVDALPNIWGADSGNIRAGDGDAGDIEGRGKEIAAQAALLGASLAYGFGAVFGRRFRKLGISPMVTATGQVTAASILLIPIVFIIDKPWILPPPSVAVILAMVGIAVISTAFAYGLYFKILATAGATNLSLVTMLIPASAIALGILFLGETLMMRHMAGLALIILGLLVIDGRIVRAAISKV